MAENAPQYLYVGDNATIAVIWDGKLQDYGKDNKNTIYQGNGWYYDSEENQLVLQDVSITNLICDGDLSILLSGTNTVNEYIQIEPGNSEIEHTLTIKGDNNGSLICSNILAGSTNKPRNLSIMEATVETSEISCCGSLTIENSHVAVTGTSGCGKSTVLKLLMGIYKPKSGRISVSLDNDKDLTSDIPIKDMRRLFAYVPQGNFLMGGSIRDVIAIARALYTERPILILDESTSALDQQTEEVLLQNLKKLTDKTVLIVTHRPKALSICNNILDLQSFVQN